MCRTSEEHLRALVEKGSLVKEGPSRCRATPDLGSLKIFKWADEKRLSLFISRYSMVDVLESEAM
jgi:hypothetical protein